MKTPFSTEHHVLYTSDLIYTSTKTWKKKFYNQTKIFCCVWTSSYIKGQKLVFS